jgi:hypothetical protein
MTNQSWFWRSKPQRVVTLPACDKRSHRLAIGIYGLCSLRGRPRPNCVTLSQSAPGSLADTFCSDFIVLKKCESPTAL